MQDFKGENVFKSLFIGTIKLYKKFISPHLRNSCRYYPTCSEYAIQAIDKKGVIIGVRTAIIRVLRCNGFFKGGFDPVK